MSYPIGPKPVPEGGMGPNFSRPIYSIERGQFIALHKIFFSFGDVSVVYQNPKGYWVVLRKATTEDLVLFENAGVMIK